MSELSRLLEMALTQILENKMNLTKRELEILDEQVLIYFFCGEHDYTLGKSDHGNCPKESLGDMREYLTGDDTIGCIAAGFYPKIHYADVRERLLINAYGKNYSEPTEDYDEDYDE